MRQIKIRAWDSKNSEMVTEYERFIERKFPVMQFTGLTDFNDKEIYEGDIVRCFRNGEPMNIDIVEFNRGMFKFRYRDYPVGTWMLLGLETSPEEDLWFEVIGNIYESPELIN